VNRERGATVISLKRAAAIRGRWTTMTDAEHPEPDNSPLRALAEQMEISFTSAGHTLTDDDTAEIYRHTLRLVQRALEGAQEQDIITAQQQGELATLIEGMEAAPRLV